MGCLFLADSGSKVNRLKQPFHLRRVYYQLLQVLPDVGSDNQEGWIGGGCRWFLPNEREAAIAMNKLSIAVEMNTKVFRENGKAATEMVNLLRAKVIQVL